MHSEMHWLDYVCCRPHRPVGLAPVVQRLDNAIHQVNRYPVQVLTKQCTAVRWIAIYRLDRVIYPPFEQPRPLGVCKLINLSLAVQ